MTGRLHVLTDTSTQSRFSHERLAELAIRGGADVVQYRSKQDDVRTMVDQAIRVADLCRSAGVTFLVNDRVDVALAAGADGVHLGRNDMPVSIARKILGPEAIVGGTARGVDDAIEAERQGATYVGLGPVFPTSSKVVDHYPIGLETVTAVSLSIRIPVIAIAGITIENVASVIRAGAYGVAVIGAVAHAEDPEAAVRALLVSIQHGLGASG